MRKTEAESRKKASDSSPDETVEQTDTDESLLPIEPGMLSVEQLDELKARAAKADDNWERLMRTTADFENFKKRAARERQDAVKFANESLAKKLVTVLDSFEMAQTAAQSNATDGLKSLQEGIGLIQQQLKNVLTEAGVEEVDATGKTFDPNLHEAVSQQESKEFPEGHVVQQLRKGYKLRDRLLRPATVIVAKKPDDNSK